MSWKTRDTKYALSITILIGIFVALILEINRDDSPAPEIRMLEPRAITEVPAEESPPELQKYRDKGYKRVMGPDGKWMLVGGQEEVRPLEKSHPSMGMSSSPMVKLQPGMTAEQVADQLGVRVEELPPSVLERLDELNASKQAGKDN